MLVEEPQHRPPIIIERRKDTKHYPYTQDDRQSINYYYHFAPAP